ncbi:MAG: T9SS type A sorting domain-containing protein [Salinivirgaceae bacterium]|nr:T9SS type A sorting domain-containing protein [Salinivirgaceae bacterium]
MKNLTYIFIVILIIFTSLNSNGRDVRRTKGQKSTTTITSGCLPATAETNLDLNNVRALIMAQGSLWESSGGEAAYEIPKGSGKRSLFAGGIWVGGVDVNGQLRTCARTFRGTGNDYWPGPLISSGEAIASTSEQVCVAYDTHFKITREEVADFISYSEADAETRAEKFADYSVPDIIKDWPAHGPTEYGAYDYFLAPYMDVDGNGGYNWENGDYPYFEFDKDAECNYRPESQAANLNNTSQKLYGDMSIWWVYNDKGNVHTTTPGAAAIGMEFRAQAFAFSTNDELNNMSFYNYQIINRSTYSLADTYFGVWEDPDLGYADDDKAGCDVVRGLGYVYNGEEKDGSGLANHYGDHPPAIGIDFFEGPYQDLDGVDNLSSWVDENRTTLSENCADGYGIDTAGNYVKRGIGDMHNGNINGLNFGDGIKDNERWGMRRFIYFLRDGDDYQNDPETASDFYKYLTGYWKDGVRMTYGGNGHEGTVTADFMFPDNTDECGWGVGGADLEPWNMFDEESYDQRIIQSAGPFLLEPGAVNDITVGVVWARSSSTAWASVEEVRKADIKAQRLFENCFQLIDGPSAPNLNIIELDGKFIFHISNDPNRSNNYLESYHEKDPFIDQTADDDDKFYDFQGYQVYQLKDLSVTTGDLLNDSKARQVFQCDVKDDISQIINYTWDSDIQSVVPHEMVNGTNTGIVHSFEISQDLFATGQSKELINYKEYYYIAVAYAHNDYKHYDAVAGGTIGTQTKAYLAGRLNIGSDGNGALYAATPHSIDLANNGMILHSNYGDVPEITMVDGMGTGDNYLELTDETIDNILSKTSYPYRADKLTYKSNYGPIQVRVIDPINVMDLDYTLRLLPDAINLEDNHDTGDTININNTTGFIYDTKWELSYIDENGTTVSFESDNWIRYNDEKLIPELGLSVKVEQINFPTKSLSYNAINFGQENPGNNGFLGAKMTYEKDGMDWLGFVPDLDGQTPFNWIRAGKQVAEDGGSSDYNDYLDDPDQEYEKVLGGTWAPYCLASKKAYGPANEFADVDAVRRPDIYRLASVDIVITKDKDKWTRCPVVEMAENTNNKPGEFENTLSEGGAIRFTMRAAPSVDKDGNPADITFGDNLSDADSPNYIKSTGMGWFPGYAIDVETGMRLNMIFGEDSWLVGENGNDMLWNPTSEFGDQIFNMTGGNSGTPYFGGKHYIYVVGNNRNCKKNNDCITTTGYDEGRSIIQYLDLAPDLNSDDLKAKTWFWRHVMWTAMPVTKPGFEFYDYASMPDNTVTINLRVANPYMINFADTTPGDDPNDNYPMWEFSTSKLSSDKNNLEYAKSALENINIVPNPYYGYSTYESTQTDNFVKIINLPDRCIVSVYTANGNLVRRFNKDNTKTYIQWDLKNQYDVPIASGMYIIHINAPQIGEEKILKWFGSLRPVDLNAF